MSNQPISAAESARRVALYQEGYTFAEIGRICGVRGEAVRLHLKRIGEHTPRRDWRHVPDAKRDRAVELYQAGYELAQIERSLRVSRTMLYNELRRRGIANRYPKRSAALRCRWAAQKETS